MTGTRSSAGRRAPVGTALRAALAVAVAAGCSGLDSWSDFDPARVGEIEAYETWGWAPYGDGKAGDIRSNDTLVDDPAIDDRIRASIEKQMTEKGYRLVETGEPDFRIGYHVSVEGRMDVSYVNAYYGYGWGGYWGASGPPTGVSYTTPTVRQYREGTLIVDVVDGGDDQLVWRGVVQGEVHESGDAIEREQAIDRAVKSALKDFPSRS